MDINALIYGFIISMLPAVTDTRAAIPIMIIGYGIPWYWALIICTFGTLLPVTLILLLFDPVSRLLKDTRMMNWIIRYQNRHDKIIKKYGWYGLFIFIVIPCPGTGVWGGTAIAFLLGISFKRTFSAITSGVLVTGLIATYLSVIISSSFF